MIFFYLFFFSFALIRINKIGYHEYNYSNESIKFDLTPPYTKVVVRNYPEGKPLIKFNTLINGKLSRNVKVPSSINAFTFNTTQASMELLNSGLIRIWIIEDTECTGEIAFYDLQSYLYDISQYRKHPSCWFFSDSNGLNINALFQSTEKNYPYLVYADGPQLKKQKCDFAKCSLLIEHNHSYMSIENSNKEYNLSLELKYSRLHYQYGCSRESAKDYQNNNDSFIHSSTNCTDLPYKKIKNDSLWKNYQVQL